MMLSMATSMEGSVSRRSIQELANIRPGVRKWGEQGGRHVAVNGRWQLSRRAVISHRAIVLIKERAILWCA